jgi:hypothetical protein
MVRTSDPSRRLALPCEVIFVIWYPGSDRVSQCHAEPAYGAARTGLVDNTRFGAAQGHSVAAPIVVTNVAVKT